MIVVVDSSVVIDLLRARAPALDVLVQANERNWRLACSILTKVEILRGMRPEEDPGTRNLLAAFDWIEVDIVRSSSNQSKARVYKAELAGGRPTKVTVGLFDNATEALAGAQRLGTMLGLPIRDLFDVEREEEE